MSEEGKQQQHHLFHHHDHQQPGASAPPPPPSQHYGTFHGVPTYPPPSQPAIGFPQPAPPPGMFSPSAGVGPAYYAHGHQAIPVQGYVAVVEGRPVREPRLPCCGIGMGWFMFIIGFFLAAIPWYVGAFVLLCARVDHREKPGYVACTIANSRNGKKNRSFGSHEEQVMDEVERQTKGDSSTIETDGKGKWYLGRNGNWVKNMCLGCLWQDRGIANCTWPWCAGL